MVRVLFFYKILDKKYTQIYCITRNLYNLDTMSDGIFSSKRDRLVASAKALAVVAGVIIPFFIFRGMFPLEIMSRGIKAVYIFLFLAFFYASVIIFLRDGYEYKASAVLLISGIISLTPTLHGVFLGIYPWPVNAGFIWFCLAMGFVFGAEVLYEKEKLAKLMMLGGEVFFIFLGASVVVWKHFPEYGVLGCTFFLIAMLGLLCLLVIIVKNALRHFAQKRSR